MAIKKGDFVELEYTGRIKDNGEVFDTTEEKVAKDSNIFNEKAEYKPIVICVGQNHVLPGIDEFLEGKEPGEYKLDILPEKAFGKKKAELLQMIPMSLFAEQKIKPFPGLQLNIDNHMGTVKTVSGGRVVVDFNHPLASKEVVYDLKVNKIVTDKKEQINSVMRVLLGITPEIELEGKKAKIVLPKLPEQLLAELKKKIEELVKDVEVEFVEPSKEKPKEDKKEKFEATKEESAEKEKELAKKEDPKSK